MLFSKSVALADGIGTRLVVGLTNSFRQSETRMERFIVKCYSATKHRSQYSKEVLVSSIRIIAVPSGSEPLHIREQWVGMTLPVATKKEYEPWAQDCDVDEYLVSRTEATNALDEAGKEEAASFWIDEPGKMFLAFKKACCELVPQEP